MRPGKKEIPSLNTVLSPSLLNLYDISDSTVVIIDVLRATSTIAAALYNGAKSVIPVDSVAGCIKLGKQMEVITAGERDGKIAEGLQYGNTPLQYSADFIKGKTLVLTTTNGTKLLHVALAANANAIITGSFCNISSVCDYLVKKKSNVMLACAAWKNRVNIEDTLFAGAVVNRIKQHFDINCDAAMIAESLYLQANGDLLNFMKEKNASHYHRLMNYGLLEDIKFCLTEDNANVLSLYSAGRLIAG
ncbi:2-phosphosulfolactate phosphatase [Hanamia caeni]|jgi:2-phosphosulfolactate phosphatase|uniref:Probable 2-phosphosulfolactate phosphatase n=1 Tax=Hanamia caeni TaxID=2294116 RepID=A0A3M9N4K0_9BACT|nr:2-phosphosulfolactate phosphatase [Hanamia caeni]RNI32734.1 2-phosphosulfolactate phosphatase [Hanamia caeni]